MPIYEYECDKCGHAFEREQRMADPPVKTCPKCKGRKVTKLISQTSFVLKGGGWYADGYSDSKGGKSSSADSSSSTDSSSSDAGDSKPKGDSKDSTKEKTKDKAKDSPKPKGSKQSAA